MSKAFTSEETVVEPPPVRPPPRLAPGEIRYITREGNDRLRRQLAELEPGSAPAQVLAQTLATLTPVDPQPADGTIHFGSTVTLRSDEGERIVRIVGADEAQGREAISVAAPLARALLGKRQGDPVEVTLPRGTVEYEILRVA